MLNPDENTVCKQNFNNNNNNNNNNIRPQCNALFMRTARLQRVSSRLARGQQQDLWNDTVDKTARTNNGKGTFCYVCADLSFDFGKGRRYL